MNKLSKSKEKFDIEKNKKYKIEIIEDSAIYTNKTIRDQLLGLHYNVFQKSYLEAKDILKRTVTVIYL